MMRNSSLQLFAKLIRVWPKSTRRWKSKGKTEHAIAKHYQNPEKTEGPYDDRPDMGDRGIATVDPCNIDLTHQQPRVVIIGAGMAGLTAAARLAKLGITNVVVLEAYQRPGGRILSCWLGDIVAELGAHWKHDDCCTHPVHRMSAVEDPPRPGEPAAEYSRGLFHNFSQAKMPYPASISAYFKFRQIEQEAAEIYCHGGHKQHGSLLNFMSLRIQQEIHEYPEEQQYDVARIMFGMCHQIFARSAVDMGMLCADNTGTYMNLPGGDVRIPMGMFGILAPILRDIPHGAIRYCKPVNCIFWGTCVRTGYRAVVRCGDGEEFPADYVIITLSLGTLYEYANKMFCPALPCSKIDAMRCLGFGHCDKIYLEYSRPFWYWQEGNLNFKNCFGVGMDWTSGIKSIEIVPHSKHVMMAWVLGEQAVMSEAMSNKDVAEGVTSKLRSLAGFDVPYPCAVMKSHWSSDPYFLGAYSCAPSCSDGSAQRALACPLPGPNEPIPPILLFAGEATVPGHFATVAGARLSGLREAERVATLTNLYQGPPNPIDDNLIKRRQKVTRCRVCDAIRQGARSMLVPGSDVCPKCGAKIGTCPKCGKKMSEHTEKSKQKTEIPV